MQGVQPLAAVSLVAVLNVPDGHAYWVPYSAIAGQYEPAGQSDGVVVLVTQYRPAGQLLHVWLPVWSWKVPAEQAIGTDDPTGHLYPVGHTRFLYIVGFEVPLGQ